MTIIAGLTANEGKRGIVIGSDRARCRGNLEIATYLKRFEEDRTVRLSDFIHFLKNNNIDKVKLTLERKIEISKDKSSVLAHTGSINGYDARINQLLLDTRGFLSDEGFVKEMLFPIDQLEEAHEQIFQSYKSSFSLKERIKNGYSPEIRRISDIQVVQKNEINFPSKRISYWDRNYNANLSEYLFVTSWGNNDVLTPVLLDINPTGTIFYCDYCAKGAGETYALEYLRDALGTGNPLISGENRIEKPVTLEEAVNMIKGAIKYANEKSLVCKGLDYVVITETGIEEHFSDEQGTYEIDLAALIKSKLKGLRKETRILEKARKEYIK